MIAKLNVHDSFCAGEVGLSVRWVYEVDLEILLVRFDDCAVDDKDDQDLHQEEKDNDNDQKERYDLHSAQARVPEISIFCISYVHQQV